MNSRQFATDVDGWHLSMSLIPDFRPDESAKWITAAAELALAAKSKLNCGAKVPGKALRKTKFGNSAAAARFLYSLPPRFVHISWNDERSSIKSISGTRAARAATSMDDAPKWIDSG